MVGECFYISSVVFLKSIRHYRNQYVLFESLNRSDFVGHSAEIRFDSPESKTSLTANHAIVVGTFYHQKVRHEHTKLVSVLGQHNNV